MSPVSPVNADPIRLHYHPGTRAVRVRWLLEEIGVPYELTVVRLGWGAHKRRAYLDQVHPLGKVPALEIDNTTMFESLGIALYLADRFPDAGLAPPVADRLPRADYCTWMAFSAGTLEPAVFEEKRAQKAKERGAPNINLGPGLTRFSDIANLLEDRLLRQPYLLGTQMSAADVLNASIMSWAQELGLLDGHDAISQWVARLQARPAYVRAMQNSGWNWLGKS